MRSLPLAIAALLMLPLISEAASRRYSNDDVRVEGYTKSDGTTVAPYYRSKPNSERWDNYGYDKNQPAYNPSKSERGAWGTLNSGRLNDDNSDNDSDPGYGRYSR